MKTTFKIRIDYILNALGEMSYALKNYKAEKKDTIFYYYAAQKKAEEVIETAISLNQDILADYFDYITKSYFESFTHCNPSPTTEVRKLP